MALAVARASTVGAVGSGTSQTSSFGTLPASGSLILVALIAWRTGGGVDFSTGITVADNQGNGNYGFVVQSNVQSDARACIFYKENIGGPSGTFTVTASGFGSGTAISLGEIEVTGAATSSSLDRSVGNNGASGTTADSGTTAVTVQANEIAFAVSTILAGGNPVTFSPQGGYTDQLSQLNNNTLQAMDASSLIVSATGTQHETWTITSGAWCGCIATFKQAGGGGGFTAAARRTMGISRAGSRVLRAA